MKHLCLLSALLLATLSTTALADSPEAIIKDYRKQAAQAVERLNQSLEKTATPMITKLVQQGDTIGAELLTAQHDPAVFARFQQQSTGIDRVVAGRGEIKWIT